MVRNDENYRKALEFRKRGFTLDEIAKICDVSKSTISKWLKNKAFSAEVTKQNKRRAGQDNAKRLKLINKARSGERDKRYKEVEHGAAIEYKHYKTSPLFTAGLMVYLTQGDKPDKGRIRLAGTQTAAHALFVRFLVEFLGVQKDSIHVQLFLYQGQSEEVCMKYWRKQTTLPYSQFYKTQYIRSAKPKDPLHFGVGNTIIGSTVLKRKLLRWMELAQKDIIK